MVENGGVPTLIFQQNTRLFLHAHTIQAIFSYSIKKPKWFFLGQNIPIFQYSTPSPGLIFQWIVLKKSTATNYHTYFMTNDQY